METPDGVEILSKCIKQTIGNRAMVCISKTVVAVHPSYLQSYVEDAKILLQVSNVKVLARVIILNDAPCILSVTRPGQFLRVFIPARATLKLNDLNRIQVVWDRYRVTVADGAH